MKKIRAEFLADGVLCDDVVILSALLNKRGIIKNYFSKVESKKLKERLKEIKTNDSYPLIKEMFASFDEMVGAMFAVMPVIASS